MGRYAMYIEEQDLRARIRDFIKKNISIDDGVEISDSDDIFSMRYVNSMFAMRLLKFIERLSDITVSDEDISLANFSSVDAMVALIEKQRDAL
jgi:methoxymalonate biosynthesis acyl carrier protein